MSDMSDMRLPADAAVIAHQAETIAQLRTEIAALQRALAVAQAELDRSQPIVVAAARIASGPDAESWHHLYLALENPPDFQATERQKLLAIALAAWKLSDEISEFGQVVNSETMDALDRRLVETFGDGSDTAWISVQQAIRSQMKHLPYAEAARVQPEPGTKGHAP